MHKYNKLFRQLLFQWTLHRRECSWPEISVLFKRAIPIHVYYVSCLLLDLDKDTIISKQLHKWGTSIEMGMISFTRDSNLLLLKLPRGWMQATSCLPWVKSLQRQRNGQEKLKVFLSWTSRIPEAAK